MSYQDLRDFMAQLEATGELRRVHEPVSPHLEMTALSDRVLRASGPALLFTQPTGHHMPVLTNLFGTPARVARAMGVPDLHGVRALGQQPPCKGRPAAPAVSPFPNGTAIREKGEAAQPLRGMSSWRPRAGFAR